MLDPLTSLSLACNVMQIIGFCHELASVVKRIKNDGTVDAQLREHAVHISDSSKGLEDYLKRIDTTRLPTNQSNLTDLAYKCLETSKKIQDKLGKIDGSRGGRIPKAFGSLWAKTELARLEKTMQKYQDVMQTQVLLHIW
jgi:hypothetical protein